MGEYDALIRDSSCKNGVGEGKKNVEKIKNDGERDPGISETR